MALLALGGLALLALLIIFGIATWVAHHLTLVKRLPVQGHPSQFGLAYEDVVFPSRKDQVPLRGWYLPTAQDQRCVILVQGQEHHRNSPGIRALSLGADLVQRGFSVLLFDFRGRGESGGKRDSHGDRERWDVLGAIDYVQSRGIPPERTGLVGFSLGAAVAILVAAREPRIPAVVSDSGFLDSMTYLKRMPFYWFFLPSWFAVPIALAGRWFFGADFSQVRPIKVVGRLAPRPVFFIHGETDQVVPPEETEALFRASNNPANQLWIVPGAGHVRCYSSRPEEYAGKVADFFQRYMN